MVGVLGNRQNHLRRLKDRFRTGDECPKNSLTSRKVLFPRAAIHSSRHKDSSSIGFATNRFPSSFNALPL
jgi:hypothetical protein